ncbi:MAG: hypothetical protein LJE61_06995 [Thiocapsa sp.]|nr:hypothetical protein [Thiocapsa sp.]MCG6984929.1 hypothetical protein [Thiocapsa sp.]
MVSVVSASLVIFLVLAGWIWVQQLYARFAARYPELGPFRKEEAGCACGSGHCERPGVGARPVPAPRLQTQPPKTDCHHPRRLGLPTAAGSKEHAPND